MPARSPVIATGRYDQLSKEQLVALLEKERREKKLGLVWERDAIEPEHGLNDDFVALALAPEHSTGFAPFKNLLIEGDNFDVLRHLHIAYRGRVKVVYIDPPYNTGGQDFVYNDRFVDKEHRYRHSLWLEFMARRLELARDLLAEDGIILVSQHRPTPQPSLVQTAPEESRPFRRLALPQAPSLASASSEAIPLLVQAPHPLPPRATGWQPERSWSVLPTRTVTHADLEYPSGSRQPS